MGLPFQQCSVALGQKRAVLSADQHCTILICGKRQMVSRSESKNGRLLRICTAIKRSPLIGNGISRGKHDSITQSCKGPSGEFTSRIAHV